MKWPRYSTIDGDEQDACLSPPSTARGAWYGEFREEGSVAGRDFSSADCSGVAFAGNGANVGSVLQSETSPGGAVENRSRQRMLGTLLERGRQRAAVLLPFRFRQLHAVDARLAFGEGAGLVEHYGVDA